jgi:hypothetical protein
MEEMVLEVIKAHRVIKVVKVNQVCLQTILFVYMELNKQLEKTIILIL